MADEKACGVAGCDNTAARRLQSNKSEIEATYRFCHEHAETQPEKFPDLEVVGDA